MKILLIGEYYSENLGDPLLCQTVEKIIKDTYPDTEITPFDMSGRSGFDSFHPLDTFDFSTKLFLIIWYKFQKIFLRSAFFRAFRANEQRYLRVWSSLNKLLKENSFDMAVFAGGSIFMDYFAGIIYMLVKRLSREKMKILFHACGMSSLDTDTEYLLKCALRNKCIMSISLRDSYERFCALFSTSAKVIDTFDTALGCSNFFSPSSACIADYGIGLMGNNRFYAQQKDFISQLLNSGVSWKVFTNGSRHDFLYAEKILTECGIAENQIDDYLVPRPKSSNDLVCTVTQFKKIISFRMHSQIVAASFGIPCFGFAWDKKVMDMFKKLGLPCNFSSAELNLGEIQQIIGANTTGVRTIALDQAEESRRCLIRSISAALSE